MRAALMSNCYYSVGPLVYPPELPPLAEGEVRGHAWSVVPVGRKHILSYMTGELADRTVSVAITKKDYLCLAAGTVTFDAIRLKYSVG
jgi:hypothetical protein